MKARPILFSGPMVSAILRGQKTQTRRTVKPQPVELMEDGAHTKYAWRRGLYALRMYPSNSAMLAHCPYGTPGDLLWVRETWSVGKCADGLSPTCLHIGTWIKDNGGCWYAAGGEPAHPISPKGKVRSSLHMPRWASRLTLEVTRVRVERLQDISEADAIGEGMLTVSLPASGPSTERGKPSIGSNPRRRFEHVWSGINGTESWAKNPWVWAVTFDVHETNVECVMAAKRAGAAA